MIEKREKMKFRHRVKRFYTSAEWLGDEEGKVRRRIYALSFSMMPFAIAISIILDSEWLFFLLFFSCVLIMTSAQLISKNRWLQTEGKQLKRDAKQIYCDAKQIYRYAKQHRRDARCKLKEDEEL